MLLLVALMGQSTTPVPSAADITVRVEQQSVVVTVYPCAPRAVKSVRVQPHQVMPDANTAPKPVAPHTTEALSEKGVRATFELPHTTFHFAVTLDDNSVHLLDAQGGRLDGPNLSPRKVEPLKLLPTLGIKSC
jgi:hypothetical protein